jgi:ferric enterobactin receptor
MKKIQRILFGFLFVFPLSTFAQAQDSAKVSRKLKDTLSQELKAVVVTGVRAAIKSEPDKLIYNPAGDILGTTALDVLRKVPMVSVDIDGNVELQGNTGIRFLVNGKPSSIFGGSVADALQAIPASQIQRIEVITSPGAKYDAEGTAGIINIVLKESKVQGVNGSILLSAGTRLENGAFNFNARKGNIGLNAFFSGNEQMRSITLTSFSRRSFNSTKDSVDNLYQNGDAPFTRNGYQSGLSMNWLVAPKDEITATLGADHGGKNTTGLIAREEQSVLGGQLISDQLSQRTAASRFNERSVDWSLAYKRTFTKEGQKLDLLYTSTLGTSTADASQVSVYPNNGMSSSGWRSNNPGNDRETDISIDYSQPLAKGFMLSSGVKAVLENIHNSILTDTLLPGSAYGPDAGQTYGFRFQRDVYAAYGSASFSFFKDFLHGETGLRYEYTRTASDLVATSIPGFGLWAPSFNVEHKLDETQTVKFTYAYRVERPDYDDLNPYVNVSDPNNISAGNPLLKTETGHKFELGYSKTFGNSGSIYLGGYYNYNFHDAENLVNFYALYVVSGVNYYNVSVIQPQSIGLQTTVGGTIYGSVRVNDRLSLRSDIALREINNVVPGVASVAGFTYKLNLNADYQFGSGLAGEIFGNYTSRRTVFEAVRPAFLFYTLAVKKLFPNKHLSLGVTATNLFNRYVHQLAQAYGPNFEQSSLRQVPLRSFGIVLSYKFGKLKAKEDEQYVSATQLLSY